MLRYVLKNSAKSLAMQARDMSTYRGYNISAKAAKEFVNDDKGNHGHVVKETCIAPNCEIKKCPTLCDEFKEGAVEGHNTHKPLIGRFAKFISPKDATGAEKAQYCVKVNQKKIVKPEDRNDSKKMKTNSKQTDYINKHRDKYED